MIKFPQALHYSQYRVYYEDTDAGGVVYHANYLRYMERARTDWLSSCGINPIDAFSRDGTIFVVKSANLEFHKPARLSDLLRVSVEIEDLGAASLRVAQRITRDSDEIAAGRFRIACLDIGSFKICRVPAQLRDKLTKWKISN